MSKFLPPYSPERKKIPDHVYTNLIIDKAFNALFEEDPHAYMGLGGATNHGRGLCTTIRHKHSGAGLDFLGLNDTYEGYHNSWGYLMPAILKVAPVIEIVGGICSLQVTEKHRVMGVGDSDLTAAYNALVSFCEEIAKDLPKTEWLLENKEGMWITKDYKKTYDYDNATEESVIPTTWEQEKALSFNIYIEADNYKTTKFQARHISPSYRNQFKPTEYEVID